MEKTRDFAYIARKQCLMALISAAVVAVCVCVGVTMNLVTLLDENFDHMGIRTFCMFTVDSNILTGAAMLMAIPYAVDGLRTHNFHMPRWIVTLLYMSVTAVALTFLVSLFILSPVKGFWLIFSGSRFFLHAVCPLLAIAAFCFFMSEKRLHMKETLLAGIPVLIYAVVYYVMVVVIGVQKGGWDDFYGFATRVPIWVSMLLITALTTGIAFGIRALHNRCFYRKRAQEADFYQKHFSNADVPGLVAAMARGRSRPGIHGIFIPTRIIMIMLEESGSSRSLEECCEIFVKEYCEASGLTQSELTHPLP